MALIFPPLSFRFRRSMDHLRSFVNARVLPDGGAAPHKPGRQVGFLKKHQRTQ